MAWYTDFVQSAKRTDTLQGRAQHVQLLAAGLAGEVGSILAEIKKEKREGAAYSARADRMVEEFGDVLWYFGRLQDILAPEIAGDAAALLDRTSNSSSPPLPRFLELGARTGRLLELVNESPSDDTGDLGKALIRVLEAVVECATGAGVALSEAATENTKKRLSRWPGERTYHPFFDGALSIEEQIPRRLDLEFVELDRAGTPQVLLRCNGINLGDRLTDNTWGGDDYRYHDVFHFGHAVFLGWSPVVRGLLNCKRKSDPSVDENEDGARALILEEAISAMVFVRAKRMAYFEEIDHLDYDLLKSIQSIVAGYEVGKIPLWQWEEGILRAYAVFRDLRDHGGGRVLVDLEARTLTFKPGRVA